MAAAGSSIPYPLLQRGLDLFPSPLGPVDGSRAARIAKAGRGIAGVVSQGKALNGPKDSPVIASRRDAARLLRDERRGKLNKDTSTGDLMRDYRFTMTSVEYFASDNAHAQQTTRALFTPAP